MLGLITDRTQRNVSRRATLSAKGWLGMTTAERAEWLGNPLDTTTANLFPPGPYYSSVVNLKYRNQEIVATAVSAGTYLYAVSIVGDATYYEGQTFTLSIKNMSFPNGAKPQISAYWHDDSGFDYAGASISAAGSVTFNTADFPNTNSRQYLALYIYVTTDGAVEAGAEVKFNSVMLNKGAVPGTYVPYIEILATDCTKGAYNYSDLNRVERAVAEISDIVGFGFETKTDWRMWDIPKATDMERYLHNIRVIRDAFTIDIELPATMDNLTYNEANNIEKILLTAYEEVTK